MPEQEHKVSQALDPRVRLYRDPFAEMFVFMLSALGASVIVPLVFLVVLAVTDRIDLLPFVAISAVAEIVLIFGLARPQMKPWERVAWATLWGSAAAFFALCFHELVVQSLL
jgi:hypothetical protein